jgi:hypothetical protein
MQCKELEAVLEAEGLSTLPLEAREHLAGCFHCQDLLADLSIIVVAANNVPAEIAPPDRIWISIRAQLEAEGIIRDTLQVTARSSTLWWRGFAEVFRPRALAMAAAAIFLVAGTVYVVDHHDAANPASTRRPAPQSLPPQASQTPGVSAPLTAAVSQTTPPQHSESTHLAGPPRPQPSSTGLRRSPSEDAYLGDSAAVLAQTEDSLPRTGLTNNAAVDASLRQNLRTLNEFIAECESRLKQNPQDQLTREYLNMAYQQKAELLTAMMDSGRSEH